MKRKKSDIKADISTGIDRQETTSMMEPLLISENSKYRFELTDLAFELASKSSGFTRSLPAALQESLAQVIRAMNCYYSNLIEGHDTHPIDIERALQGDYSKNKQTRNLQKEAIAHIAVQEWIDKGGIENSVYSPETIRMIHKRFCDYLPEDFLWIEDPQTKKKVQIIPGDFRKTDVKVGGHIPISPGTIPRFMNRFSSVYSNLSKTETILSLAAAHHRLLWIHPFLDGNGRVARLMSYAITRHLLNSNGLWSIARGLARNVVEYKQHLANCDMQRRNDLDGRGNLSEEALAEFTHFFLTTCIDQVDFMEKLMQPDLLRTRVLLWAKEEIEMGHLYPQSFQILEAILYRGEIPRSEISTILNVTDRHARRLTANMIEKGILISDTPRSALKLAFPPTLANRWMPGLFPDK